METNTLNYKMERPQTTLQMLGETKIEVHSSREIRQYAANRKNKGEKHLAEDWKSKTNVTRQGRRKDKTEYIANRKDKGEAYLAEGWKASQDTSHAYPDGNSNGRKK